MNLEFLYSLLKEIIIIAVAAAAIYFKLKYDVLEMKTSLTRLENEINTFKTNSKAELALSINAAIRESNYELKAYLQAQLKTTTENHFAVLNTINELKATQANLATDLNRVAKTLELNDESLKQLYSEYLPNLIEKLERRVASTVEDKLGKS